MRFRKELSSAAACAATDVDGVLRDDYPPRVTSFGPVAQRQSSALIRRWSVDRSHLGPPMPRRAARSVRGRLGSSRSRCASAAQVRVLCSPPSSCSPVRLTARTRPFQRRNTGSIPVRDATRGCSSRVEQPAFNRQARVRSPASAPTCSSPRRCVVERPQTAGFDPVYAGSNPAAPTTPRDRQAVEGSGLQSRRRQALAGSNPAPESIHFLPR